MSKLIMVSEKSFSLLENKCPEWKDYSEGETFQALVQMFLCEVKQIEISIFTGYSKDRNYSYFVRSNKKMIDSTGHNYSGFMVGELEEPQQMAAKHKSYSEALEKAIFIALKYFI